MDWKRETGRDLTLSSSQTPESVGPGSYNIVQENKVPLIPGVAFGTTAMRDFSLSARDVTPAPGTYEVGPYSSRSSTAVFHSSSRRDVFPSNDNPSPADYSRLDDWTPKRNEFSKIRTDKYRPESPMVGQDVVGYVERGDGSLKAVKKFRKDETYLAPGTYSPQYDDISKPHSMKETYRSIRFDDGKGTPGPGSYSPKEVQTKMKSQIRPKTRTQEIQPPLSGELQHTPWKTETRPSSGFKSRSKREIFVDSQKTPSPTAYAQKEYKRPTSSVSGFGQRSLRFHDSPNDIPGPGQYEAKKVDWVPNKGTRQGTIRSKTRGPYDESSTPGPGSYNIATNLGSKKRPNSSFTRAKRKDLYDEQNNPGPGSYDIDRSLTISGLEIHGSRLDHGSIFSAVPRDNPAPNAYYQTYSSLSSRGCTIPRDDRFKVTGSDTPGPGSYNIGQSSMIRKSYHADYLKRGL